MGCLFIDHPLAFGPDGAHFPLCKSHLHACDAASRNVDDIKMPGPSQRERRRSPSSVITHTESEKSIEDAEYQEFRILNQAFNPLFSVFLNAKWKNTRSPKDKTKQLLCLDATSNMMASRSVLPHRYLNPCKKNTSEGSPVSRRRVWKRRRTFSREPIRILQREVFFFFF